MHMVTDLPAVDQPAAAVMAVYNFCHGGMSEKKKPFTKLLSYWLFPLDLSTITESLQVDWWILLLCKLQSCCSFPNNFYIYTFWQSQRKTWQASIQYPLVLKFDCNTFNRLFEKNHCVMKWKVTGLIPVTDSADINRHVSLSQTLKLLPAHSFAQSHGG